MNLGPGIALRREFLSELFERVSRGDSQVISRLKWIEVMPENFLARSEGGTGARGGHLRGGITERALRGIAEAIPVALHGVSLSVGGADPLDQEYLAALAKMARELRARWVSDHLCYSSAGGVQLHNLLPLPLTRKALRHVVARVKRVQTRLSVPFALENASYYGELVGSEVGEAEFLSEVVARTGCGLILDINNVYVNCFNRAARGGGAVRALSAHALEAGREFLRGLPLDRVIEVHIAGHKQIKLGGKPALLDTHGAAVIEPVRELLRELNRLQSVGTLLLEREQELPPLDEILGELDGLWGEVSGGGVVGS